MLITKEEKLQIVREIMDELSVEVGEEANDRIDFVQTDLPVETQPSQFPLLDVFNHPNYLSANSLLDKFGPLPRLTTIIGVCEDGLPLLFDLSDPAPGSILITGNEGSGKASLLRSLLVASSLLNPPDDFRFYLISPTPANFRDLYDLDHCIELVSSYDRASAEVIVRLAAVAEQRRSGRFMGPITILAIDDLSKLLQSEDFELVNHLKWLLSNGPKNGIWPVATLGTGLINNIHKNILSGFKTCLIAANGAYQLTPGRNLLTDGAFDRSITQRGSQRINFWIPELY